MQQVIQWQISITLQEEIASVNLAKYRKLQHDLEEAETRAKLAEKSLNQHRALNRSSTAVEEIVTVCINTRRPTLLRSV